MTGASDPRELYEASYRRLVAALALVAGSTAEAEEVVQEAFVRLIPRWSRVSRYEQPEAWVRRVALNQLSNRARKSGNGWRALRRSAPPSPVPGSDGAATDVRRALATLPLAHRQVVVLHHLLDLPVDEVARELGVPVGTVKSRLSRARSALAPLLREEVDDHG